MGTRIAFIIAIEEGVFGRGIVWGGNKQICAPTPCPWRVIDFAISLANSLEFLFALLEYLASDHWFKQVKYDKTNLVVQILGAPFGNKIAFQFSFNKSGQEPES